MGTEKNIGKQTGEGSSSAGRRMRILVKRLREALLKFGLSKGERLERLKPHEKMQIHEWCRLREIEVWRRKIDEWHRELEAWHRELEVWHREIEEWYREIEACRREIEVWRREIDEWYREIEVWRRATEVVQRNRFVA